MSQLLRVFLPTPTIEIISMQHSWRYMYSGASHVFKIRLGMEQLAKTEVEKGR